MSHYVLYGYLARGTLYPARRRFYERFHLDIGADIICVQEEEESGDIHMIVTEKDWTVWDNPHFWYDQTEH
jgi:hypothetical protein